MPKPPPEPPDALPPPVFECCHRYPCECTWAHLYADVFIWIAIWGCVGYVLWTV